MNDRIKSILIKAGLKEPSANDIAAVQFALLGSLTQGECKGASINVIVDQDRLVFIDAIPARPRSI